MVGGKGAIVQVVMAMAVSVAIVVSGGGDGGSSHFQG